MGRIREVYFISIVCMVVFLFLSVVTYHNTDSSWTHAGLAETQNLMGKLGAWTADILLVLSGYVAYVFPALVGLFAWRWLFKSSGLSYYTDAESEEEDDDQYDGFYESASTGFWLRLAGFVVFMLSTAGLVSAYIPAHIDSLPAGPGGITGSLVSQEMIDLFNISGATLILCALMLSGLTLSLGVSWIVVFDTIGQYVFKALYGLCHLVKQKFSSKFSQYAQQRTENQEQKRVEKLAKKEAKKQEKLEKQEQAQLKQQQMALDKMRAAEENAPIMPNIASPLDGESYNETSAASAVDININQAVNKRAEKAEKKAQKQAVKKQKKSKSNLNYSKAAISFDVLNPAQIGKRNNISSAQLTMLSQEVEQRLLDFGIKVEVVGVHPGPVITRFELALSPGMKAGRISNLSTDLARSLSAVSVRVVEVIPGKSVVGLEIPNQTRELVSLREVLESKQYQEAKSPVSLALGKDISGHPVVVDLAKMPHLLVAGTTGSGKSVGVNAMLLSLLYKSTPEEVRLILVDPKMLELSVYDGIPHLLTPVVTDMKEAANALRWCVAEMEKRYKLMAAMGVRNLAGYNDKIKQSKEPIKAPEWYASQCENGCLETLPTIVVVIDEFADMMMVVGKKVEQLIARIAQKARAAGIHLILATQRPSVNVITGLIKANIPTRIAFQVSSKIDSRTILDQQGAQQLLGHGDMLYLAPGSGVPVRVHGAFVADDEVHRVVAEWQQYGEPEYLELGYSGGSGELDSIPGMESDEDGEKDALYDQAVQIVIETRKASISSIQRRLKIGYNRAARLVETMEEAGLVGPMENSGGREVLIPEQPK